MKPFPMWWGRIKISEGCGGSEVMKIVVVAVVISGNANGSGEVTVEGGVRFLLFSNRSSGKTNTAGVAHNTVFGEVDA